MQLLWLLMCFLVELALYTQSKASTKHGTLDATAERSTRIWYKVWHGSYVHPSCPPSRLRADHDGMIHTHRGCLFPRDDVIPLR